jgi:hypothetical protein
MKKQIISSAIILLLACSFISCRKGNTEVPAPQSTPVDNNPAFTNAIWVGEFHYRNASVQPFTALFKDNGEVLWREVKGDFNGTWVLDNGEINIFMRGSAAFKATVAANNKLANIVSTDVDGRIMDNAHLDSQPQVILENTTWVYPNFTATFKPGGIVDLIIGTMGYTTTYTQYERSVRFSPHYRWRYFMVTNASNEMNGSNWFIDETVVYSFTANKK